MTVTHEGQGSRVLLRCPDGFDADLRRYTAEFTFGCPVGRIRTYCGRLWSPQRVHWEHSNPGYGGDYEQVFACPMVFDAAAFAVDVAAETRAWKIPGADARLRALLERSVRDLQRHPVVDSTWSARRGGVRAGLCRYQRLHPGVSSLDRFDACRMAPKAPSMRKDGAVDCQIHGQLGDQSSSVAAREQDRVQTMTDQQRPNVAVILIVTVVVVGGLVGATLLLRSGAGSSAAGTCSDGLGCKSGLYCLQGRCTPSCDDDSDCAELGWKCTDIQVVRESFGIEAAAGQTKLCAPEGEISRRSGRAALERSGFEKKMTMSRQRRAVQGLLMVKRFKPGEDPPKRLDDATFNALWAQIPEVERLTGDAEALAEKMMELEAAAKE